MTSLYDNIIFGPVHSRRLGLSLGVNLLPIESKLCSFDCIYCECGWNADHRGARRFNAREDVRRMLAETLDRMCAAGTPPCPQYARGVQPKICLNLPAKYEASEKPHSLATSDTVSSLSRNKVLARSMRKNNRRSPGV